jgi:hypothetical protein
MSHIIPNEIENKKIESIEDFDNSAEKIYRNSSQIADDPGHGKYLKKKGLRSEEIPGLRFGYYHQYPSLVIPIRDINGVIQSIQYIYEDHEGKTQKRFLKDAEKQNCFLAMGDLSASEVIFVTEGVATAASLQKILAASEKYSSCGVVCSFSAQSMVETAKYLAEAFEYSEIIAAPDADEAGNKASIECKILGIHSIFPPMYEKGTDWNDVIRLGNEAAAEEFNRSWVLKGSDGPSEKTTKSTPEIKNILERIEEDPCGGFSMQHFTPVLRTYVESLCETTEAHPIMIIMSVLCSISAMVGKRVYMPRGEYFQNLYPNIWSLCITKSGGFKTTALNKGSEIALEDDRKILQIMDDIRSREDPNFDILQDDTKFKDEVKKEILMESLKRPMLPTRITTEFLIKHLAQGHQGMILSSELGEWLGNMQKNHNVDLKQIFTYFYDVDIAPYEHRTKHCGNYIVRQPFVTINGVSTVDWVQNQVKADDVFSGFFARILLFAPPFENKIPHARPKKKEMSAEGIKAKKEIAAILEHLGEIEFSFSEETASQFDNIHESLYQMVRVNKYDERCQKFLEPYLKRWSPYVLKLAMIFRVIEDPLSNELSTSSIKAATEIIRVAIKSTAKLFKNELGESEDQSKQRKVYKWIVKRSSENKKAPFYTLIASRLLDGGSKEYEEVVQTLIDSQKIRCFNQSESKKNWLLEA